MSTLPMNWRAHTTVFYGWYLAAALFLIMVFTGGIGFYVFPVFVGSLHSDLGWSITQISGAIGLWAIVFGLSGPLVGAMSERFGPRKTILAGAALAAFTAIGLASMSRLWMLYALQAPAGCSCAATTLVPGQTLITNWFTRHRGRAMAVMMMGMGGGGFLLPPLYELVIRTFGWRVCFACGAAAMLGVVIPATVIFVRDLPSPLGLLPDGLTTPEFPLTGQDKRLTGLPVSQAVKTLNFGLLLAIYLLQLIGMSVLNFHFVPFASIQAGFTAQQAALFLGFALGFSVVGQFGFGWLADRFNPVFLQAATGLLMALGIAAIELGVIRVGSHDTSALWGYAVGYGLGLGGQNVLLPLLVGQCFGELHFSKILGLMMGGFAIGAMIGIPVAGWSYDRFRTYEFAFLGCLALFLLSGVLAMFIRAGR
ncbi:MAG TPA: MFS transporter, partial [Bryobacteraceae bacterium]|nr:MFS transporter [Bryobacteraceae bacterium]